MIASAAGQYPKLRLTVVHLSHWGLTEHMRLDLGVQMLHCVSIWATGHAPHESRWVYLSTWCRHAHLLLKVRRYAARLRSGLAWVMDHAWRHVLTRRRAWMLLWHARVWRESLSGHHFDYRLSTAVDVGQSLSSLLKWHALPGGDERYRSRRSGLDGPTHCEPDRQSPVAKKVEVTGPESR